MLESSASQLLGGSIASLVSYPDLMVAVAVMATETTCDLGNRSARFLVLSFVVQVTVRLGGACRSSGMASWDAHQLPASWLRL
jgi:hypothetical protein